MKFSTEVMLKTWTKPLLASMYQAFQLRCWRRLLGVPRNARRSNQSILKEINMHWKNWCWSWSSNTLVTSSEKPVYLKRLWCWERLKAKGEDGGRGWDGWMASPSQWTWVWANSWRMKWQSTSVFLPGKLYRPRSLAGYSPWSRQRVRCYLATQQQQHMQYWNILLEFAIVI